MVPKQIKDLAAKSSVVDTDQFPLDDNVGSTWKATGATLRKTLFATPTQGNILYYNGTDWVILAPGTTGQHLQTFGVNQNPTWVNVPLKDGEMYNGRLNVTVVTNNLTVALKTRAGNDPSVTDPVVLRINNTYQIITAPLSVTANAGTNWCNAGGIELATQIVDYCVYLGYNVTDGVTIGFSRYPFAYSYGDFSVTPTNEKFAKISTITSAVSTDYYMVIGRFAATLSAGAGYTWTVPTFTANNLIDAPIRETRWLNYAPSWTGLTVGDGTIIAKYKLSSFMVVIHESLIFGAGTSISGGVSHTLPFSRGAYGGAVNPFLGKARFYDQSAATSFDGGLAVGAATVGYTAQDVATYVRIATLSAAIPFTWAVSDEIHGQILYEAA